MRPLSKKGWKLAQAPRLYLSIYIYIYIYNCGPISRSRTRNQHSPGLVTGAKSHFSWCPVSGYFSGCIWRHQGRVLGSLLEGSGLLFSGLRAGVCEGCEKVILWSVLWSEEQTSCIARTCKPYSTSFKNRRCASDGLRPPQCLPKAFISPVLEASKSCPTPMFSGTEYQVVILGFLGVSWRPNLQLFWHARSGTRMPKIDFLKPPSVLEQFFSPRRSLEVVSGPILNHLCIFLVGPFGLLGGAILFAALRVLQLLLSVLISIHDPVLSFPRFLTHLLLLASASSTPLPCNTWSCNWPSELGLFCLFVCVCVWLCVAVLN